MIRSVTLVTHELFFRFILSTTDTACTMFALAAGIVLTEVTLWLVLTCKTVNNLQCCTQLMIISIVTSKLNAVIDSICVHTGLLSTCVCLMCYGPK